MSEKIYLITSNPGKVESFKKILKSKKINLDIEMFSGDYPEIKEDGTTSQVVLEGAKYCAKKYKKDVLVQDTGLFIEALNGFPGVNTKFCLQTIGYQGILKLLDGEKNRKATWIFSLGYCEIGGESVEFTASLEGEISKEKRGNLGFGFDEIFIPKGYKETFGENPDLRDRISPFNETIDKLVEYLRGKSNWLFSL